jgi:hypothetical protein
LIEISKEHIITSKLESIENDVTPIIIKLNSNGLPLDIGVVVKIRNQYLNLQKECAEKVFSHTGYKFDLGKKDQIENVLKQEGFKIGKSANALVMDRLRPKAKRGRVQDRIKEHLGEIPGATVNIEQFGSISDARSKEKNVIKRNQPKYNKEEK